MICFTKGAGASCYENEFESASRTPFNMHSNYTLLRNSGTEQCIDIAIHIHAALIDSLKLLLRGGEGGLLPGDGGRGTRIMVNNNYS